MKKFLILGALLGISQGALAKETTADLINRITQELTNNLKGIADSIQTRNEFDVIYNVLNQIPHLIKCTKKAAKEYLKEGSEDLQSFKKEIEDCVDAHTTEMQGALETAVEEYPRLGMKVK